MPADMAFQICFGADLLVFCPLSHLLRKCQLSQRESRKAGANFLPYAQSKLVSPSGRDVAQRQRGLESADMAFQICPDTNLSACCPLSHLLRKCQLSQRESREAGANFLPYAQSKLVSPFGRDVAQRQRGLVSADMAFQICPDTGCFVFRTKQNRASFDTLSLGGRWWIRTTEVVDNRFTVCPLWPLGKPPIFTCRNRGAGGRT